MKRSKTARIADYIFFAFLMIIFSVYLYRLVVCQAIYAGQTNGYYSDIIAYITEIDGTNTKYNFAYPLFFLTGRFFKLFFPTGQAAALTVVLYNGLTLIATKYYMEKAVIKDGDTENKVFIHIIVSFVSAACSIMAMWWLPRFGKFKLLHKDQVYYGTFTGNPWHNATYIATKPFSIVAFFSFTELLEQYEEKIDIKKAIIFSLSLFLSAMAKPTFNLVLISAAGIILLYRLIRAKFANLKQSLALGACFFPTFAAMLIQYADMFVSKSPDDVQGIKLSWFEVWKLQNPHIPEAVFYANVFALIGVIFFAKDFAKDCRYRFTLLFFGVSFLEAGLLCEKGIRFPDFNFSWGYMHGIFFFGLISATKLLEKSLKKGIKWFWLVLLWSLFFSQVIAGALYFKGLYWGYDYKTLLPMSWVN